MVRRALEGKTDLIASTPRVTYPGWLSALQADQPRKRRIGREFYEGFPPTWEIVADQIPATLTEFKRVKTELDRTHYIAQPPFPDHRCVRKRQNDSTHA